MNRTFVQEGHWRIAARSETILRCPYGENGCIGGQKAGDFLCGDGFYGLLCAKAPRHKYIDWVHQDSIGCNSATTVLSVLLPTAVVAIILLSISCSNRARKSAQINASEALSISRTSLVRMLFWITSKNVNQSSAREGTRFYGLPLNLLHKAKLLVFVLQVTASVPASLHLPLGPATSAILQIMGYLSLPSLQALPWKCLAASSAFSHIKGMSGAPNYLAQMAIATVLPLVGLFLAGTFYALHMELVFLTQPRSSRSATHRAYTAHYGAAALWLLHFASGGAWSLTAGMLSSPCVNADPDGVYPGADLTVMLQDVSVSCTDGTYHTAYLWALLSALIYMVLLPVLQGMLIFQYRSSIQAVQPSRHRKAEGSPLPSTGNSDSSDDSSSDSEDSGDEELGAGQLGLNDDGGGVEGSLGRSRRCHQEGTEVRVGEDWQPDGPSRSSTGTDSSDRTCEPADETAVVAAGIRISSKGSQKLSQKEGGSVKQLTRAVSRTVTKSVLRRHRSSMYFPGLALLYQACWTECAFWELRCLFARWFYLALLPSLFPYYHPAQALLGVAVTLIFLQRLMSIRPYASAEHQLLAQCGVLQILLLYLCAVGQQLELQDVHVGAVSVLDAITCLVVCSTPALFLWQLVTAKSEQQEDCADDVSAPTAAATIRPPSPPPPRSPARSFPLPPSTPPVYSAAATYTPQRSGTAASANLSRSPAGSLHFSAHRNLATCTQETVTYDVLSAEKKARLRFPSYGGGSEDYSSAEEKADHLSTDSDQDHWLPPAGPNTPGRPPSGKRYLAGAARSVGRSQTLRLVDPPSPDSTPPESEDEHLEPFAPHPLFGKVPQRARPAPLKLRKMDLHPLGSTIDYYQHQRRNHHYHSAPPSRSLLDPEDLVTEECSATAGNLHWDLPSSPSTHSSPYVSYSPEAGIFPECSYAEYAQAPYPYQPDLDYQLASGSCPIPALPAVGESPRYREEAQSALSNDRADANRSGPVGPVLMDMVATLHSPTSATAGRTFSALFSASRASTPRAAAAAAGGSNSKGGIGNGSKAACTPSPVKAASPRGMLRFLPHTWSGRQRTSTTSNTATSPTTPTSPVPRAVSRRLSGTLLQQCASDTAAASIHDEGNCNNSDGSASDAESALRREVLDFDPEAYYTRTEEYAASDGQLGAC